MASNLLDNLFDIIKENNISKNFGREGFKESVSNQIMGALKDSPNDKKIEFDLAVSILYFQAERNPEILGNVREDGSFYISEACINSAIKTVKYENQFNPNMQEYKDRNSKELDSTDIILTPKVIDTMLSNFDDLSADDLKLLRTSYGKMDPKQKDEYASKVSKALERSAQKEEEPDKKDMLMMNSKGIVIFSELRNLSINGTPEQKNAFYREMIEKIKEMAPETIPMYEECLNDKEMTLEEIYRYLLDNVDEKYVPIMAKSLEEYKNKGVLSQGTQENSRTALDFAIKLAAEMIEKAEKNNLEFGNTSIKDLEMLINPATYESEKTILKFSRKMSLAQKSLLEQGASPKYISDALEKYKQFFSELDEEDISEVSKWSDMDFSSNFMLQFEDIDTDPNVRQVLEVLSSVSFDGNLEKMLMEGREEFFSQIDEAIKGLAQPRIENSINEGLLGNYYDIRSENLVVADIKNAEKQTYEELANGASDINSIGEINHQKIEMPRKTDTISTEDTIKFFTDNGSEIGTGVALDIMKAAIKGELTIAERDETQTPKPQDQARDNESEEIDEI